MVLARGNVSLSDAGVVVVYFRYKVTKQLGDGTYGSVWKAVNMQTKDPVSMGRMACTDMCTTTVEECTTSIGH